MQINISNFRDPSFMRLWLLSGGKAEVDIKFTWNSNFCFLLSSFLLFLLFSLFSSSFSRPKSIFLLSSSFSNTNQNTPPGIHIFSYPKISFLKQPNPKISKYSFSDQIQRTLDLLLSPASSSFREQRSGSLSWFFSMEIQFERLQFHLDYLSTSSMNLSL